MSPLQRAWRGSKNDWRLHALSIFSVSVAFVCLASALLVVVNVDGLRTAWAKTGRASVYLTPSATEDQVSEIQAALRKSPGVQSVRHVTSDKARSDLVGHNDDPVLSKLPDSAFPASLEVVLEDTVGSERIGALKQQLGSLPAVESVETYEAWLDRLAALLAGGVTAALLLAAVVLGAVVSVVASTIRLTLQRRRIEVEVLKLVGATDEYVRRPFVIEGAAQGATGALLATLVVAALFLVVRARFDSELGTLVGVTPLFLPWYAVLSMITAGGLMGAVAAYASLRRLMVV
jgi:cell division transport system permease protein